MRTSLLLLSILLPISPTFVYSWNETKTSVEPSTTSSNDITQSGKIGLIILTCCLCSVAIAAVIRQI